jgi:uncharacterized protein YjbI with pentapeptide repeats
MSGTRMSVTDRSFRGSRLAGASWKKMHFLRCDFTGAQFVDCTLADIRLDECTLDDACLRGCRISDCAMFGSRAAGAELVDCTLTQMATTQCQLTELAIAGSRIEYWSLTDTALDGLICRRSDVAYLTVHDMPAGQVCFSGGRLHDAVWFGCHLSDSRFDELELVRQVMGQCVLERCDYRQVSGQSATWHDCSLDEVILSAWTLERASFHRSRLRQCDFSDAQLSGALFAEANLAGCILRRADLTMAVFDDAVIEGGYCEDARAAGSRWRRARLARNAFDRASLRDGDLRYAEWVGNELAGTAFAGALMHGIDPDIVTATNTGADFSGARFHDEVLGQIDAWHRQTPTGPAPVVTTFRGGQRYV